MLDEYFEAACDFLFDGEYLHTDRTDGSTRPRSGDSSLVVERNPFSGSDLESVSDEMSNGLSVFLR